MDQTQAVAAVFQPVSPPTTFEETVERLGVAIRLGLLAPGSQLPPERDLADQLGISRSTLRHALTTLVQSGHLVSQRGRGGGTFVTPDPPLAETGTGAADPSADWRERLDWRATVEIGIVALAAERAQPRDLERLATLADRMDAASSRRFDLYRRADVRFHIGLAEATRSARLVSAATDVQGAMSDLIARIAHPPEVLTAANRQHRAIIAALARRDRGRATRLVREHLEGTEHILAGLLPG